MQELGYSNRETGAWIYTEAWIGYRSLDAGAWYRSVNTRWWDSTLHMLENRSFEKDDYSVYRELA
jgi:hypothetical protein